jgi:hypothetical protein
MAKNIEKIAAGLGANIKGNVPQASSGAFGAARLARAADALSQGEEPTVELLGSMRDYADEMDEIVADAMRQRQVQTWRPNKEDFAALEAMSEATNQPLTILLDQALRLFLGQALSQSRSEA